MPQLDTVSFFSQYIWTTTIFFATFFLFSKYFLPTLARTLLFREKKYSLEGIEKKESGKTIDIKKSPFTEKRKIWEQGEKLLQSIPMLLHEDPFDKKKGWNLIQTKRLSILKNMTDVTEYFWSASKKKKKFQVAHGLFYGKK
jgi:hypothetical protein